MPKERLDLMIDGTVKRMLKGLPRARDCRCRSSWKSSSWNTSGRLPEDGAQPILYLDKDRGHRHEGEIVLDCVIDEHHFDIVSTYGNALHTISVRMGWTEAEDGSLEPYDLRIWAEDKVGRGVDSLYDWNCGFGWPGMAVKPGLEEPTVDQGAIPYGQNPRKPA